MVVFIDMIGDMPNNEKFETIASKVNFEEKIRHFFCILFFASGHYTENNQLICSANQLNSFCMMRTLLINELMILLFDQITKYLSEII